MLWCIDIIYCTCILSSQLLHLVWYHYSHSPTSTFVINYGKHTIALYFNNPWNSFYGSLDRFWIVKSTLRNFLIYQFSLYFNLFGCDFWWTTVGTVTATWYQLLSIESKYAYNMLSNLVSHTMTIFFVYTYAYNI